MASPSREPRRSATRRPPLQWAITAAALVAKDPQGRGTAVANPAAPRRSATIDSTRPRHRHGVRVPGASPRRPASPAGRRHRRPGPHLGAGSPARSGPCTAAVAGRPVASWPSQSGMSGHHGNRRRVLCHRAGVRGRGPLHYQQGEQQPSASSSGDDGDSVHGGSLRRLIGPRLDLDEPQRVACSVDAADVTNLRCRACALALRSYPWPCLQSPRTHGPQRTAHVQTHHASPTCRNITAEREGRDPGAGAALHPQVPRQDHRHQVRRQRDDRPGAAAGLRRRRGAAQAGGHEPGGGARRRPADRGRARPASARRARSSRACASPTRRRWKSSSGCWPARCSRTSWA